MFKIKLDYNNAYNWYKVNNTYVIGHIFYEKKLYRDEEFAALVDQMNKEEMLELVKKDIGFFSIVKIMSKEATIISDIIRSFPVFYKKEGNSILITDNPQKFVKLNLKSVREMNLLRYVSGPSTLYDEVFQIESAQIITIDKNKNIVKEKYFRLEKYNHESVDKKLAFKELDAIFTNIFKKLIIYLDGKTAVIPLSGGHDSRLIAYYLKKLKYPKIITYTYGKKENNEAQISEKVADFLELEWHFVPYKNKVMRKKYNNKNEYGVMSDYCGRGFSIPHLQEWVAIDYLLYNKIIPQDGVVIPGHTLDFITGGHLNSSLINPDNAFLNVLETIKLNNYNLYKPRQFEFEKDILSYFNVKDKYEKITNIDACNHYENWNYNERQTKFIVNSIRTYDYRGLEWFLPFWEINLINYFQKLPLELKFQRTFFKDFVNYKYKSLMEIAPTHQVLPLKTNKLKTPRSILLFKVYFSDPLNFYGFFHFFDYVLKTLKYKTVSYDLFVCDDYLNLLLKREKKGGE